MNFNTQALETAINCIAEVAMQAYEIENMERLLVELKRDALHAEDQKLAAHIWCLQEAVAVHNSYFSAFSLLKKGAFYDAWCELENTEKGLWAIKAPQSYLPDYWEEFWNYGQYGFIEEHVPKWQALFPYRLFCSPGMTYKQYCSVCDVEINPRKPCDHKDGEIYNGEMRARVVRDIRYNHIALVKNPANKFAFLFLSDPETGEKVDHYDYSLAKGLISVLDHPFQRWDYDIQTLERDYAYFKGRGFKENDLCPCGSKRKYSDCCILSTVSVPHYQFSYAAPSQEGDGWSVF
ncbi:MAG: SEC-C domain-containing protein [Cyanobacteria bacterium P01_F01_bin.150]